MACMFSMEPQPFLKIFWRWDKYALVNKHFLPTQSLGLKVKQKPEQTVHSLYIDLPEAGPEI